MDVECVSVWGGRMVGTDLSISGFRGYANDVCLLSASLKLTSRASTRTNTFTVRRELEAGLVMLVRRICCHIS